MHIVQNFNFKHQSNDYKFDKCLNWLPFQPKATLTSTLIHLCESAADKHKASQKFTHFFHKKNNLNKTLNKMSENII